MNDPYKILGITPDASDDDVKKAYRKLVKKYHPDRYQNSPLADEASEKMKEINGAYDTIMNMRRGTGSYGRSSYTYSSGGSSSAAGRYSEIRILINNGRFDEAEQRLAEIPPSERNAEWYYLMAVISYHNGWLEEAYNYASTACRLDPDDVEYNSFFSRITKQRAGSYRTYPGTSSSGCCEFLTCMLCSDCFCNICCRR